MGEEWCRSCTQPLGRGETTYCNDCIEFSEAELDELREKVATLQAEVERLRGEGDEMEAMYHEADSDRDRLRATIERHRLDWREAGTSIPSNHELWGALDASS